MMTAPDEVLLDALEELGKAEFGKFKWFLYHGVREDFKPIPKGQLEDADKSETVDLMVSHYDTDALIVAREVFKKISRKDLVRKISGSIKEPTDAKRDTEQSIQPQSVQPEDWLFAVRRQLVDGLSDVTVNQLLDRLYEERVISREEMNVIRAQTAADKARQLIDWVQQKGRDAAAVLKTALREVDLSLFRQLNLTQKEQSHAGDGPEGSSRDKDGGSLQIPIIFTPEIQVESAQISYRFRCAGPGMFQCDETGLVFVMTQGAELQYRIVQWDESRHKLTGEEAVGPMFNIQCSEDAAVRQLHFPHCEADNALRTEGLLSVAHITDDGMDILKPLQITDTHVVVNITHLSLYVLIWHPVERLLKLPVRGQVLLFLRSPKRGPRTLHVFLLQKNTPVSQVAAQQGKAEYIRIPANCVFNTGRSYSLHCEQEGLTIQPESENFYRDFGPDYHPTFEVILTTNPDVVTLNIQDREQKIVWKCTIHLQDPEMDTEQSVQPQSVQPQSVQPQSVQPEDWLRPVWTQLIERLSTVNVRQILDRLYQQRIINERERDDVMVERTAADKAQKLITEVQNKGPDAVSCLKTALREVNPSLCQTLNLL